jgi:hypothetical protein
MSGCYFLPLSVNYKDVKIIVKFFRLVVAPYSRCTVIQGHTKKGHTGKSIKLPHFCLTKNKYRFYPLY